MKANNALMSAAMTQLGTREIDGDKHETEVLKYYKEIGHEWVSNDETPWCAAFMNWVCKMSFVPMVEQGERLRARGFLNWGKTVKKNYDAAQGDVVVLWRGTRNSAQGHVGLLVGWSPDGEVVYLLGGNQSNQVNVSAYSSDRILDIRRGEIMSSIVFAQKLTDL
jgi:uncharacterized protein (TIGR02594 family)